MQSLEDGNKIRDEKILQLEEMCRELAEKDQLRTEKERLRQEMAAKATKFTLVTLLNDLDLQFEKAMLSKIAKYEDLSELR